MISKVAFPWSLCQGEIGLSIENGGSIRLNTSQILQQLPKFFHRAAWICIHISCLPLQVTEIRAILLSSILFLMQDHLMLSISRITQKECGDANYHVIRSVPSNKKVISSARKLDNYLIRRERARNLKRNKNTRAQS